MQAEDPSTTSTESSSCADLELYSAQLAQQTVTWRKMYEKERRVLQDLEVTWQRANDKFLLTQTQNMKLLGRMKQLLTREQLDQVYRDKSESEEDSSLSEEEGGTPTSLTSEHQTDSSSLTENVTLDTTLAASESSASDTPRAEAPLPLGSPQEEGQGAHSAGRKMVVSSSSWLGLLKQLKRLQSDIAAPCEGCAKGGARTRELQAQITGLKATAARQEEAVQRQLDERRKDSEDRGKVEKLWQEKVEDFLQKETVWGQKLQLVAASHYKLCNRWEALCLGAPSKKLYASYVIELSIVNFMYLWLINVYNQVEGGRGEPGEEDSGAHPRQGERA